MSSESTLLHHEPCPQCGSRDNLGRYSDGHGYCFGCGYWEAGKGETSLSTRRKEITNESAELIPAGKALGLDRRKITQETCAKFGYTVSRYKDTAVQVANYRDRTGRIVAQKLRFSNKDFKFLGDAKHSGLYGQHLWEEGGRRVTITEGEIDALSVSQIQGNKWPVVSLPTGAKGAKKALQNSFEWLDTFDEIVLMFDNDEAGRQAVEECFTLGFTAGMGLHQMYATINAGSPNKGHLSDAKNGGTWGTANDKVNHQMRGHKQKAAVLLGGGGQFLNKPPLESKQYPITTSPNFTTHAPTPLSFDERVARERSEIKLYDSWFDELGSSMQSFSMTGNILREISRGGVDPFWQPDEEVMTQAFASVPKNYWPMIEASRSERDFQNTMKIIEEDVIRTQRLGEGGLSSLSAGLVAGVFDPVTWLAGGVGGKAAYGLHWGYRAAIGAGTGAASNAALDYASGQLFNDPHADPLMAAGFGAAFGTLGAILMRNPATRLEGEQVSRLAVRAQKSVTGAEAKPSNPDAVSSVTLLDEGKYRGSASAAVNPDALLQRPMDNLTSIPKEMVETIGNILGEDVGQAFDWKFGSFSTRFDIAGQMNSSIIPEVRLIGQHFVSDGAGHRTVDGSKPVTKDSVTDLFLSEHRLIEGEYVRDYAPAMRGWMEDMQVSKWRPFERANARDEFHGQITDYIWQSDLYPNVSPHVAKAAQTHQNIYAKLAKMGEEAGLWQVKPDPRYVPLYANTQKIADMDINIHHDNIYKMLESAIIKHSPDINPKLANAMAAGYWDKLRKAAYGVENKVERALAEGDRALFIEEFRAALSVRHKFTDADIGRVYDGIIGRSGEEAAGNYRHAKRRTLLDYNAEFDVRARDGSLIRLKVRDFFERDSDMILRRYMHSMLGRIALASKPLTGAHGEVLMHDIKSGADLQRVKDYMLEAYRQSGRSPEKWVKEFNNNVDNIDFVVKRLQAVPIHNNHKAYAQIMRRIGTVQFIRLMSNMGLNQLMEFTRIFNQTGWRAAWSQLPSLRELTMAAVSGDVKSRTQLGDELKSLTGVGVAHLFQRNSLKMDVHRLGEPAGGSFVRTMDTLLDAGQKVTTDLSLFRHIHSYQQMLAINAITQQMADMARRMQLAKGQYDFNLAKGKDVERLATLGMGEKDLARLFDNLLEHGTFEGHHIVGANLDKWEGNTLSKFRVFLNRYTDNLVLNNDFGSLAKWMSSPFAGMILQFRTFVIGAWTKAFLHGINHWDAKQFTLIMAELMAGAATYAVARSPTSLNEASREKYINDITDPATLLTKGWARSATASVLPMLADTLLAWSPTSFRIDARSSGSATGNWQSSPAGGHLDQFGYALKGWGRAAIGLQAPTQNTIRQTAQSLLPFSNWLGFTAVLNALISPLPTQYKNIK